MSASALHVSGMHTALLQIMKSKNAKISCSKLSQAFVQINIIPAKISTYSTEFPAGARSITKTSIVQ